ncbi:hypothetical protein EPN29_11100 [bacterium]|nr:MAG: hypothetical protein EPN29_11100 [bacterium]
MAITTEAAGDGARALLHAQFAASLADSLADLLSTVWQCERNADRLRLTYATIAPASYALECECASCVDRRERQAS